MASFEEALRGGADGFETDLRLTSDQTAVLYHDDDYGDDDFESLSLANLAERGAVIQRLRDLAPFAERTTMILEVKRSKWEELLVSEISAWRNVVVASFDHETIAELARRQVPFPLGITFHGSLVDVGSYAAKLGATWCFPNFHYVEPAMVAALHEHGIKVVPWTANRERDWKRLCEVGCDGVITDFPGEAVAWRNELRTQN